MSLLVKTTLPVQITDTEANIKKQEAQQLAMGKMFFKQRIQMGAQKCQGPGETSPDGTDTGCTKRVAANKLWCWECYLKVVERHRLEEAKKLMEQGAKNVESDALVCSGASSDSSR